MLACWAVLTPALLLSLAWTQTAPGVWVAVAGRPDRPTLTDAAEAKPFTEALKALQNPEPPDILKTATFEVNRDYVSVHLALEPGEKLYGLGLQMSGEDRRGGVYHLQVDHYASGHDRLHAPTPLYISSRGYAVFFDTSRPINIYSGVGNRLSDPTKPPFKDRNTDHNWDPQPDSNAVEASVQAPGLRVVVFSGPTPMEALRRYVLYCGGGPLPPRWALGFWHRTPSLANAEQVVEEVRQFKQHDFPLDVIGLEPGWQSRSYPGSMQWSSERFPDPQRFLTEMAAQSIHVNLWENPYVAPSSPYYQALNPHFGSHTVWLGAVPDILDPKAAEIARQFHKQHHEGVSGYKIDEVDGFDNWLWPDHATFPSGPPGLQMRQIYGVLWQKELTRLFKDEGHRTFGLVRGSNGAAVRFPFAIYSDTYDHRQYVTATVNASLAGVLWCAEARSAANGEEWVRRIQSACLSPIAQLNAWDSGAKPWSFPEVENHVRTAMKLREALVPYLYTAFAQYHFEGTPPIRPMCLVDGGLETDQYLLGDSLLVAPMFVGESSRTVRLPAGDWYDYKTGARVGSNETITIHPSLDEIPLFVRGGALIPTFEGALHAEGNTYTLRKFGPGPWHGAIYDDDGQSYAFEKGDYGLFEVTLSDSRPKATHLKGQRQNLTRPLSLVP
jgi:alpha-D-xyloside xylohydrolase